MATIVLNHVSFTYRRPRPGTQALKEVCAEIGEGITAVVGPNGAGKSTLFRLLLGALEPDGGQVMVDDTPVSQYRRRVPMGFIPERPALEEHLTVQEFLEGLEALLRKRYPSRPIERGAWSWEHLAKKQLGALSLGEIRRFELAAALLGGPEVLLLDEPTNGLDPIAVQELRAALLATKRSGRAIIIASHHLDELQRLADTVIVLDCARVRGVWSRDSVVRTYGSIDGLFADLFPAAVPSGPGTPAS